MYWIIFIKMMAMYIGRSGNQENETNPYLIKFKKLEEKKLVNIDKLQLIQILQGIQEVKQSNELSLLAGTDSLQTTSN
jgi:hypothetical protein